MRAINKHNHREESFRRWVVALGQGKFVKQVIVSASSENEAITTARVNHGGGIIQWARLATAADL